MAGVSESPAVQSVLVGRFVTRTLRAQEPESSTCTKKLFDSIGSRARIWAICQAGADSPNEGSNILGVWVLPVYLYNKAVGLGPRVAFGAICLSEQR